MTLNGEAEHTLPRQMSRQLATMRLYFFSIRGGEEKEKVERRKFAHDDTREEEPRNLFDL